MIIVLDEKEPLIAWHITHSDKVYFIKGFYIHFNLVFSAERVPWAGMLSKGLEICPLLKTTRVSQILFFLQFKNLNVEKDIYLVKSKAKLPHRSTLPYWEDKMIPLSRMKHHIT